MTDVRRTLRELLGGEPPPRPPMPPEPAPGLIEASVLDYTAHRGWEVMVTQGTDGQGSVRVTITAGNGEVAGWARATRELAFDSVASLLREIPG